MELKEIAKDLLSREGNVRGEVFRTHAEYIKYKEGEESTKKIEEKLAEFGIDFQFEKVKPFEWYKEGVSSLIIITAKEVFNWTEEEVFEMGRFSPKVSFFLKVIIQYFVSMERVLQEASKYWRKHFDFGSLEVVKFDDKNKIILMRINGFNMHPLICCFHRGYFKGVTEFAVKSEKITVEETKCIHKGDPYHEYKITWV